MDHQTNFSNEIIRMTAMKEEVLAEDTLNLRAYINLSIVQMPTISAQLIL